MNEEQKKRIEIEASFTGAEQAPSIFNPREFLRSVGSRFISVLKILGGMAKLAMQGFSSVFRHRFAFGETVGQLARIGNRSFALIAFIGIFTGMVIALQLAVGLGRFGLKLYIGQIVGLAIFRELGPVLTCLMIAARVGSGIAAELGSMVVTEQVLAIEAMGANPVQKLVVPRIIATVISAPLLTVVANVIGVFGGGIITCSEAGVTASYYFDQITSALLLEDFFSGVFKAVFFGFFIAIIACYHGLQAKGGTEGVGLATTKTVVHASLMIFVLDFFLFLLYVCSVFIMFIIINIILTLKYCSMQKNTTQL